MELDLSSSAMSEHQDDGSFVAWPGEDLMTSIARRPRSEAPWEPGLEHRWSARRWDRSFSAGELRLTDAGYAAVERCFDDGPEQG